MATSSRAFVARLIFSKPGDFQKRVQINFCITRYQVYGSPGPVHISQAFIRELVFSCRDLCREERGEPGWSASKVPIFCKALSAPTLGGTSHIYALSAWGKADGGAQRVCRSLHNQSLGTQYSPQLEDALHSRKRLVWISRSFGDRAWSIDSTRVC